ncbi:MAG TPA: S1C family serine protease [Solirubrobacteraceae bacterium]|jgi:S1-C subfamily serine protease
MRGVLLGLLVATAGVILGHFAWGAPSTLHVAPASSRLFGPSAGSGGSYRSPRSGERGPGGNLFGEGSAPESETGQSGQGGGSSENVSSSVTSKVDPGLVDINTVLGVQGGEAAGTGMVVTSSGEVITNNHVIAGATKITATDVGNGNTYTARVVGYDYSRDIAVLQLEGASGLQTVSFGDPGTLKVGQSIATIGNAGGTGGTPSATGGQVVALGQSITAGDELGGGHERLEGLIELAGNLQPGDSGGPLVNSAGEVVGMDTAASQTFRLETSGNEGFAIPTDTVRAIAGEIWQGHSSSTIHLGATAKLGVLVNGEGEGVQVENVVPGSPAAAVGISAGDVITSIDGTSIDSPTALIELMLQKHPGERVQVAWQTTAGTTENATVTLTASSPQ